jgi:putative PIN family toxin of toxin-antitoxin system
MTIETPRVVFDCNIFLQAVINEGGPAFACLGLVDSNEITLVLSSEVLAEAKDVLNRPKLQKKFPNLTPERAREFLEYIERKAVILSAVPEVFSLGRDPKDEIYINLAIEAGASHLVSRDKDLLDLMDDSTFRNRFPGLTILDPVAFLQEHARWRKPEVGPSQS